MKIDGLLSKRQQSELITAIKGRGEIPLKFVYLGEGAKEWDRIARIRGDAKSGAINALETWLLSRRARDMIATFGNPKKINLIDLGCGNGEPVLPLVDELQRGKTPFCYVPVDISEEMLQIAIKTLRSRFKNLEAKPINLDFELGQFSDLIYGLSSEGTSNLFVFLGGTLGNTSDTHRVLTNFRDTMGSDDYLITGVELVNYSRVKRIMAHYTEQELGDIQYLVPEAMGVKRKETEWIPLWNDDKKQVETKMRFKKDTLVKVGDDEFTIAKDEEILLMRSKRFTEAMFTELFQDVGFRSEILTTTPDASYILSMVQPTRYGP